MQAVRTARASCRAERARTLRRQPPAHGCTQQPPHRVGPISAKLATCKTTRARSVVSGVEPPEQVGAGAIQHANMQADIVGGNSNSKQGHQQGKRVGLGPLKHSPPAPPPARAPRANRRRHARGSVPSPSAPAPPPPPCLPPPAAPGEPQRARRASTAESAAPPSRSPPRGVSAQRNPRGTESQPQLFHHFSCAGSRARPSTAAPPVVEKAPAACAVAV